MAGAPANVAARLGVAMLLLQFSIGAANDVVDAAPDRVGDRDKPLVRGRVRPMEATLVSAVAAVLGAAVAASVGPTAFVIAMIGLADGLFYDLRLKGTAWSWLPFAVGVGLLPLYAWGGATGSLSPSLVAVFGLAVVGGAALAVANALGDAETDATVGTATIVTLLGERRAVLANVLLLAAAWIVVVSTALVGRDSLTPPAAATLVVGIAIGAVGLAATARPGRLRAALGWEAQGIGLALVGIVWVQLLVSAGFLVARAGR